MVKLDPHIEKEKRTIKQVLDCESGEPVIAKIFFEENDERKLWEIRIELEEAIKGIRKPKFVCYFCKQLIKMRGGGGSFKKNKPAKLHFAHLKDSQDCPIKTDSKFTREEVQRVKYNGAKESIAHIEAKEFIAKYLRINQINEKGISSVEVEKVHKDKAISRKWKKPDVSSIYKKKALVFELQLSTTFLSVIVSREHFYKENNTFILWVFKIFKTEKDLQRFTQKDIYYSNNLNAFVLDKAAQEKSKEKKDIVFHCYYQVPYIENDKILFKWEDEFVTLDMLTFDYNTYKVFYYDSEREQKRIEKGEKRKKAAKLRREEKDKIRQDVLKDIRFEFKNRLIEEFPNQTDLIKLLVQSKFNWDLKSAVNELFLNGYKVNQKEKKAIIREFNFFYNNLSFSDRSDPLYYLAIIIFHIKVNTKNDHYIVSRIERVLTVILSLKLKKVIGYKYDKLIQVVHTIYPGRQGFMDLFIKAINKYYGMNNLLKDDLSGKFRKKLDKYNSEKKQQIKKYDSTISLIFPELFE